MNAFYLMKQMVSDDFIRISVPLNLQKGCMNSEFQYLDHRAMEIEVSLDYGTEFPDFILADGYAPFISERMRRLFEQQGIDNLFYKKSQFVMKDFDIEETYWFSLPPKIDCIDPECIDEDLGIAAKISILAERVGNYQIFKAEGLGCQNIIVTSCLKQILQDKIKQGELKGIKFQKI